MTNVVVSDRRLWDALGNSCRAELVHVGGGTYELALTEFNGSIPVVYRGPLGLMINKGQHFLDAKKAAGFEEQLPSYNPHAWVA